MLFLPLILFLLGFFAFCAAAVLIAAFVALHWLLPYAQTHGKVYLEHQLQSFLKTFYSYAQFWGFLPTTNMSQEKSLQKSSEARSDMVMQKPGPDEKEMENKEEEGMPPPSPALVAATSEEISHMTPEQQDEQVIALLHLLEQQKVHKKYGIVTHDTWRGSLYMGSGALAGALLGGPLGAIAGIIGGGAVGWWRSSHYQEVEKLVKALPPAKRQKLLLEVSKIVGKKATVMGIEEMKPFQSRIWRIVRKFATKDIKKYLDGLDEFIADTKQKCSTTKYDKPEGVEAMKRDLRDDKSVMNMALPVKQKQ